MTCPPQTSCVSAVSCIATHSKEFLNNVVLFQCGSGNLCCPPKQIAGVTFRPFLKSKKPSTGNSLESESAESSGEPSTESQRENLATPQEQISGLLIRQENNATLKSVNGRFVAPLPTLERHFFRKNV